MHEIVKGYLNFSVDAVHARILAAETLAQTRLEQMQADRSLALDWKRGHDRYEKLRRLNPRQFGELWQLALGDKHFDDLVDDLP